jgi:Arc/MetJ-type ribon-helix-helix transcriptional regulator
MGKAKVAITIDEGLLHRLDLLVREAAFPNRSRALEAALEEKLTRMARGRLASECLKLDRAEEQALAEEGLSGEDAEWPEY